MTDQKLIAGIFNDFLGLYTGKIQTGIRPLLEKYKNHPMLMGLLSNLDEAAKIQAPKAMKEIYSFYKDYRGRDLEDADWKELTEKARQISAGWEENECGIKRQAGAGDFFFCLMFLSGKKGQIMLNEIIKTAEELNTAALHYRQSGNMDGVRELAKAHAVSKKQTEEFIQGSRYRLVEIPIGERKFVNASEKLRAEMFILKDAGFADIIGQYLVNLAKTDSALEAQVLKRHKMLQRCLDYVTQKAYNIALEAAKKRGENSIRANTGLALSSDQVFPWVLEYYAKDDEKK